MASLDLMEVDGVDDLDQDEDADIETPTLSSARLERLKVPDESGNLNYKYQKEKGLIYLLPYASTMEEETSALLNKLLVDLAKSVVARDFSVGLSLCLHSLNAFIDNYGRKITKEQHVNLINVLIELITMETMPIVAMTDISMLLQVLLIKQQILTREDICIQWRPLYQTLDRWIYHRKYSLSHSANAKLEQSLKSTIQWANLYFPNESFSEIVEEFKPYLCPSSAKMTFGLEMMRIFLPFKNSECDEESVQLIKFLLGFYESWNNHPIWEWPMMNLISTAAYELIGVFDWDPYLPILYARFMRNLDLPVYFKSKRHNGSIASCQHFETASVARWIVSTLGHSEIGFTNLKTFLKSVETYYNPANTGKWTLTLASLLKDLGDGFIRRVRRERFFEKDRWWRVVPDNVKLAETDIDMFVECLSELVLDFYLDLALGGFVLKSLAVLRPNIVIPAVMEKYSGMVETLTESKKYMTTMRWIMMITNVMVSCRKEDEGYDGRHLILPLANSLIPAIDSNDMTKTLTAMITLSIILNHITVVDCSSLADTIEDEEQREICLGTAGLDDFVIQLLDKVFTLIENRSHENTRMADSRTVTAVTMEDLSLQRIIWGVFRPLATHSSTAICKVAVKKIVDFTFSHTLEVDVSGKNFGSLCQAFAVSRPDLILPKLLPRLCSQIQLHITDDILDEEELDKTLLFYLLLMANIMESIGTELLSYRTELEATIRTILKLNGKKAYGFTSMILMRLLNSLTYIYPLENRLSEANFDDPNYLAFQDWGTYWHWKDTRVNWHVPSMEEVEWAKELFLSIFVEFSKHFEGISERTEKDEKLNKYLLKNMTILHSIYDGLGTLLPFWDETPITPKDCVVDFSVDPYEFGLPKVDISVPGTGENVRLKYFNMFKEIQAYLEKFKPDDTDAFISVIRGYDALIACYVDQGNRYIVAPKVKQHSALLPSQGEFTSLNPWKRYTRFKTIIRAYGLHQRRLRYLDGYAGFLSRYVTGYIAEKFLPGVPHDEYKGALYVLQTSKCSPILINSWEGLSKMWLAILHSPFSEKNSIIQCMQNIQNIIARDFIYFPLKETVPVDSPVETLASKLVDPDVWAAKIQNIPKLSDLRDNHVPLNQLIDGLLEFGPLSNQHWRKQTLCLDMLSVLVVEDIPMRKEVIACFWEALISPFVEMQKIGLGALPWILTVFKRKYETVLLDTKNDLNLSDGVTVQDLLQYRSDEKALEGKYQLVLKSKELPLPLVEVHKIFQGFTALPRFLKQKICPLEFKDYSDQATGVRNVLTVCDSYLTNPAYIEKLLNLWSMEDRTKNLVSKRTSFAKLVARNHGPEVIEGLVNLVLEMSKDRDQWKQRCVSTLLGGFIFGIKLWDRERIEKFWMKVQPALSDCLDKVTQETFDTWISAMSLPVSNRDGNKMRLVIRFLQDRLSQSLETAQLTSVDASNNMSFFSVALANLQWRGGDLYPELLQALEKYFLDTPSPYRAVRVQLGRLLAAVFEWNIEHAQEFSTVPAAPELCGDFLTRVLSVLSNVVEISASYKPNEPETQDNVMVRTQMLKFKTVLEWIIHICWEVESTVHSKFYCFIPWLCHFESYEPDPEIAQLSGVALAGLSKHLIRPQHMDTLLDSLTEVAASPFWKARLCVLEFLKVFTINNASIIASNEKWSTRVVDLVLSLLRERKLEVRELASRILCGFLHCLLVPNPMDLLQKFKVEADACSKKRKLSKSKNSTVSFGAEDTDRAHSAVLGICAFVDTHPYDVPAFLPDVLVHLTRYLNDPQPIPATVRKCLSNFRRTHHDNWTIHKSRFSEDQLCVLTDIFVSPCYYA